MLSDVPRQQLAAICVLNAKVADDDRLCEAFLRDYCGAYRREIAALTAAVRWGVPKSLREDLQIPPATLRANLARRLEENQGLELDNAFWAVDVWASVIRPQNSGWQPVPPCDAPRPTQDLITPPTPASDPVHGAQTLDWSQTSQPAAAPRYAQPVVAASVLSPPIPAAPIASPQPPYPQSPVHPVVQPASGVPYTAGASAFLAGERTPELKAVLAHIKQQLKIRKPVALIEEIQNAGVAPGIAKSMVNRVRRGKALTRLILAVVVLVVGFVMLGTGQDAAHELTAVGDFGFAFFVAGCFYSLWSLVKVIRFS
jgi:hypothetical protein